ncbi:MAG: ribosomal protein L7/L12 [Victivallales bacterium]|nr:ribosomal protein L7/L12 [Victivallales bacterium]
MSITNLSPELTQRIENIMEQYKDLLGDDFIRRTHKNMEPLLPQESEGGLRVTDETNLKVAVVGAFSCGKSTFINSILNDEVAPVEITPKTHGVTSFIFGEEETYDADGANITRTQYQEQVQDGENQVKHFIVHYPCERLKSLEFMDSPGFGSVSGKAEEVAKKDTALSEEAVNRADVVFFLTNITEGVIQGDALERLEAICNQKEGIVNPHRRIYVILTWADKKAPKERANVQQSIQKLCSEHKLPIENVLLYSSLPLEKFRSAQQREFFSDARDSLFRILLDLQQFRVELMAYRQALQSKSDQLKVQHFLNAFQTGCQQIIATQREIQTHDIQRKNVKSWTGFRDEAADCIDQVFKAKFESEKYSLVSHEAEKLFSDSRVEIHCCEDLVSLTEDEVKKIAKAMAKVAQKYGYAFSYAKGQPLAKFFSTEKTVRELPLPEDEDDAYNHLYNGYSNLDEANIFPHGSLRDLFLKVCVETLLSMGGPWMRDDPNEFWSHKIDEIEATFDENAKGHFIEIIDSELKTPMTKGIMQSELGKMNERFNQLEKALGSLGLSGDTSVADSEETQETLVVDNGEENGVEMDDDAEGDGAPVGVEDDGSLHDVIVLHGGKRSLRVAKKICEMTNGKLEEVLEAIEEPPMTCLKRVTRPIAEQARMILRKLGAQIEVKQVKAPCKEMANTKKMETSKGNLTEERQDSQPVTEKQNDKSNTNQFYSVTLISSGPKMMTLARQVSQLTGRRLEELLEAMEELPLVLVEKATAAEKEQFQQLETLGAKLEMTEVVTKSAVPTTCRVVLTAPGAKIMTVARGLSQATGRDLEELLEAMEELPMEVSAEMPVADAEALKGQLEAVGATLELKMLEPPAAAPEIYKVLLTAPGVKIMKVARQIAQDTDRGLEEVLEGLEELPFLVSDGAELAMAEQLKKSLESLGASVEVARCADKAPVKPVAAVPAKPVAAVPARPVAAVPARPVAAVPARPVAAVPAKPVAAVPAKPVSAKSPKAVQVKSKPTRQNGAKVEDKAEQLFITELCKGCTKCAKVCPADAISGKIKARHVINQELCIQCKLCVEVCPFNAIVKGGKAAERKPAKQAPAKVEKSDPLDEVVGKVTQILASINDDNVFSIANSFNQRKLSNALSAYAHWVSPDDVLLQVDDTVFGAADNGCVVTINAFYSMELGGDPQKVELTKNCIIQVVDKKTIVINGRKIVHLCLPSEDTIQKIVELLKVLASCRD